MNTSHSIDQGRAPRTEPPPACIAADAARGPIAAIVVTTREGVAVHPISTVTTVTIGRARDSDIVVEEAALSRRHARITIGSGFAVEDLGTTNGTRLGTSRLRPGIRATFAPGTVITLGETVTIVVHDLGDRRGGVSAPASSNAVVSDPRMVQLHEQLGEIARAPLSVLVLGETGVGKEVVAEAIHARSPRARGPFVRLNCAALTEGLLESELFGFEKGAFTGANAPKQGLFEAAHGGTLFLDEIGEMPLATQAKILRVLEAGEVLRLGSVRPRLVDVRFVAATNRDLGRLASAGSFRADLYFRLNGFTVTIPPLRERPSEIPLLARAFADRAARRLGRPQVALSEDAERTLHAHRWPGNVRELRNVIERAVVLSKGPLLEPLDLVFDEDVASSGPPASPTVPLRAFQHPIAPALVGEAPREPEVDAELRAQMRDYERRRIEDALRLTNGNQTKAARALGVSRRTLINKLEIHGFERPRKR
jgi:transcriptional regulator with GAF, ATPase, and Fis domain